MGLSPLDIHNKEFPRKALRGYDPDAVDEFLDEVIREFEQLIKENSHLRQQVEEAQQRLEQYRKLEETLQKTLVAAQEAAEEMKANAKREAELILQQAHLEADRVVDAGHAKTRQTMEANADLVRAVQTLRVQVRAMLVAQLQAIDQLRDPFAGEETREMPAVKAAGTSAEGE